MTENNTTQAVKFRHDNAAVDWALGTDRVAVFSVSRSKPDPVADGEPADIVTEYTMPAKPNAGLALQYLKQARINSDNAASWLLETALGSEGYDALTDELGRESDPELAAQMMSDIVQFVATRALGGLKKA